MDTLFDYIVSYRFLDTLEQGTILISDHIPDSAQSKHIHYYDIPSAISQADKLSKTDKILWLWTTINTSDMLSINRLLGQEINWINLYPGLESMLHKNSAESNDIIQFLEQGYTVYEPITADDLKLQWTKKWYYRITPHFSTTNIPSSTNDFIPVQTDPDSSYTIISSIGSYTRVLWAIHQFQQHHGIWFNLFIHKKFASQVSEELISSLKQSKKAIIIIDHRATEEIWNYYENLINQNLANPIDLHFVFPQFHLVQSILPDYIYEEAYFDEIAISDYLESLFQK